MSVWKYIPVRRTALFIEESLRGRVQWVVFEANDEGDFKTGRPTKSKICCQVRDAGRIICALVSRERVFVVLLLI